LREPEPAYQRKLETEAAASPDARFGQTKKCFGECQIAGDWLLA